MNLKTIESVLCLIISAELLILVILFAPYVQSEIEVPALIAGGI